MKTPLSMEQWSEIGSHIKQAETSLQHASDLLRGHIPKSLLNQLNTIQTDQLLKVKSRLEDTMFFQHQGETGDRLNIFFEKK